MNLINDMLSLLGYSGPVTELTLCLASMFLFWIVSSIFGVLYSAFKR